MSQSTQSTQSSAFGSADPARRVRAFGYFVIALIYFFFAQQVAARAAKGLSSGDWSVLVERAILLFLLLVGYGAMGRALERQRHPLAAMGLALRPGGLREFGLGAALAWAMVIVSILPMVFSGGLMVSFWTSPHQFGLLFLDLVVLALASLAEEVAFRGYPFQRLIEAIGPVLATLGISVLFGFAHIFNPNSTNTAVVVTIFAGWLLSAGYLRTRALWLPWGWHFAWNVCVSVLFGLPLSGLTRFSPVIQSNTIGPAWMTGGDYGPEGSLVAAVVLLVGTLAVFRATRAYAHRLAQPIVLSSRGAGEAPVDVVPVDVDAAGQDGVLPHPPAPPSLETPSSESPSPEPHSPEPQPPESQTWEKMVQPGSASGSGGDSQHAAEGLTLPATSVSPPPAPPPIPMLAPTSIAAPAPALTPDCGAVAPPTPLDSSGA